MSLQVIETGELVEEMTRVEAERITSRIADKLDAIADNLDQVLPLIGEALTREAWRALGYNSPTAYVSERFAGALTRLPVEVRRPVVAQLSAAGMSTRAIAPIVGKSHPSIVNDLKISGGQELTTSEAGSVDEPATMDPGNDEPVHPRVTTPGTITGLDGKQYERPAPKPEPKPEPMPKPEPKRRPLTDQLRNAGWELTKATEKLQRLFEDDRFERNKKDVTAPLRGHIENNIAELTKMLDQLNK